MVDAAPTGCLDAVVVVPGILGTELLVPDGEVVWGLGLKQPASALLTGKVYERLRDPALAPREVLRVPAWLPGLDRFEPYTALTNRIAAVVRDRAAVREHPYDWRRP